MPCLFLNFFHKILRCYFMELTIILNYFYLRHFLGFEVISNDKHRSQYKIMKKNLQILQIWIFKF